MKSNTNEERRASQRGARGAENRKRDRASVNRYGHYVPPEERQRIENADLRAKLAAAEQQPSVSQISEKLKEVIEKWRLGGVWSLEEAAGELERVFARIL